MATGGSSIGCICKACGSTTSASIGCIAYQSCEYAAIDAGAVLQLPAARAWLPPDPISRENRNVSSHAIALYKVSKKTLRAHRGVIR